MHLDASAARADITGLILCGGRGSRMGGVDKGLQPFQGLPLAMHALQRLSPQVGAVMISANRNLSAYAAMGVPVWPDALAGYPGPLAGWLAGLAHCTTPHLLTVPCDTPGFPADLAARLAAALTRDGAQMAMAATLDAGRVQLQPVFCLLDVTLRQSLAASLAGGERRVDRWALQQRCATVVFDDARAFFNANTLAELQALETGRA
jgi:molybdenum cofactor guanylyltransferase